MNDLISRTQAIDAIRTCRIIYSGAWGKGLAMAEKRLRELPTAQPKSEERTEESAQNVPKEDLISRKAAIGAVEILLEQTEEDADVKTWNNAIRGAINSIKHHVPSAQQVRTQMSSADCISRQDAIDAIRASTQKYKGFMEMEMYTDYDAIEAIEGLPSAQPQRCEDCVNFSKTRLLIPQPETAKRIVGKSKDGMTLWYQCDMCNEPVDAQDNFCRGCGRRLTDG